MDPLSIIAGVAGIATAGVSLVEVLFDTIDSCRNAPKDIVSLARGIQDLSIILDQLKQVLIDGRNMHTRWLLKSVASAIRQIEYVHADVWELIPRSASGFDRVKWTFRKGKVRDLMNKIETQKSTVQLVCTTLLLALQQKKVTKYSKRRREDNSEKHARSRLRRQAENLVKTAHESLLDLTQTPHQEEIEAPSPTATSHSQRQQQPHTPLIDGSPTTAPVIRVSGPEQDAPDDNDDPLLQKTPDETALWLYDMVFAPTAERKGESQLRPDDSNALVIRNTQGTEIVLASQRPMAADVVDDLLYDWTHLSWHDIKETSETAISGPQEQRRRYSDERPGDTEGSSMELPYQSRRNRHHSRGASEDHARRGISVEYESEGSSPSGRSVRSEHWAYVEDEPSNLPQDTTRRRYSAHETEREPPTPTQGYRPRSYSDAGPEPKRNPHQATVEDDFDDISNDLERKRARERAGHEEARRRRDSEFEKPRSGVQNSTRSNANRSRDRESDTTQDRREDRPSTPEKKSSTKLQKAAMASLLAGATEAFRVAKHPGGWAGEKTKRVLTAAAAAATVDQMR